ncbi:glycosyltransferase family 4 protein [Rhodanobacter sp. AS-Z3]|uniref:MraY family glycosyltransferase n=1 Tax=Rhodanobacter sp. AS-Z3 TaxID=3031330 RepID=UPI00247A6A7C|nr:glycosyltransferase family 4 protein [Rhodanobacter sp. AS-Z3]WEN16871.1 glycosyltransferase family 4 protein [Rhodanobacter sp. AS-Z3]
MLMTMGWLLSSFLVTVLVVRGSIGYARRRGMLDLPGQRRSHQIATPRGGGIGVVVAMLICLPGVLSQPPNAWPASVTAGLLSGFLLVAVAGWWDDHRSLPVLPRLLAQLVGIGLVCASLLATGTSWWWLFLLLPGGVWSVNLHNFMDGIDGLLAQQVMFVGAGLALLAYAAAQPALALAAAVMAVSMTGFWWFNRSPARIFMGDVGSGSVGLLIFAFTALLWQVEPALLWPAMILSSVFVVDATLTLLTRIWRGRRWYTAHREHLYQWLVRRGRTHAGTAAVYLGWNLLVAAPMAWLAWSHLRVALPITMAVYTGTSVAWLMLKRRCLRRDLSRMRHVAA